MVCAWRNFLKKILWRSNGSRMRCYWKIAFNVSYLLTYISRLCKLLYSLRIWNFSLVLKLKPRKWNFATTQTHFLHYFWTRYYCSLLCNNSKTLYAPFLNSLLFVCILQHHKLWQRSMILSNEWYVVSITHMQDYIIWGL